VGEIVHDLPLLLRGAEFTVVVCAISGVVGSLVGLVFGMARASTSRVARVVSAVYINFIRGVPPLVILFFAYFVIPLAVPGVTFTIGFTVVLGLSVYAGAYMAEIVRGSIEAVPTGQSEAAEALGMGYLAKLRYVVLPQAMKIAVPPGIGFLIALVKASSLASVIGAVDITKAARILSTGNNEPLKMMLMAAALYFVVSYPISLLGRWYERRLGVRSGVAAGEGWV